MNWLAGWDFPSQTSPALPVVVSQLIFALLVSIAMIVLRMAIDTVAPGAGPLALIYPAVTLATLFGRWLAGLLTLVATMAYTVIFLMMSPGGLTLMHDSDGPRVVVNSIVLLGMIVLLEIFRRAIAQANAERDRQIERGELLLRELDHRMKNNFAAVASLLQMQGQRATDPVLRAELASALSRVESIATAHRFLYRGGAPAGKIDMADYLRELCGALETALLSSERVRLRCTAESVMFDRDRAALVGLIVNELVTNAARHAFVDGRAGTITVAFRAVDDGHELAVEDDGCGLPDQPSGGGLGRRLITAFVGEAQGELVTESSHAGTRCTVRLRSVTPDGNRSL